MSKIFVTYKFPDKDLESLRAAGHEVLVSTSNDLISREKLLKSVAGANAILSLLTEKIDKEVIDAAGPQLKIIANNAVGFDNIDLNLAKERGIIVTNTPNVLSDTVAEHAFALIISLARRIPEADRFVRAGNWHGWQPELLLGQDLNKRKLGIIGLGRIGAMLANKAAKGFDMQIIYFDMKRNLDFEKDLNAIYKPTAEEVFAEADFISIHLPYMESTHHFVNAKILNLMKPTSYLINTARGAIVEELALVEILKQKKIAGAALDVFEHEPQVNEELLKMENVILTPHIASATTETRNKMLEMAKENILAVLAGKNPVTPVNL